MVHHGTRSNFSSRAINSDTYRYLGYPGIPQYVYIGTRIPQFEFPFLFLFNRFETKLPGPASNLTGR